MAGNLFTRFLPPGTGEPSIYEALREQDESELVDVEERAGMAGVSHQQHGFHDDDSELDSGG